MFQDRSPYTNTIVKTYPEITDVALSQVLAAADAYYHAEYTQPVSARALLLAQIADAFDQHAEALAKQATQSMGKRHQEALGEAHAAANIARYYAEKGPGFIAPRPYLFAGGVGQLHFQATGIVLAIEPWNFPYTQVMRVFAPNFLLGNPVVLKHAENVPGCAVAFEALVNDVAAAGAFTNVFATHAQVTTIIQDPRVQGVALTGSPQAGQIIAATAGAAMTKTTLELGGNDAFVVLADADLDAAAQAAADSRLRNAGQVCTSAKRFIVEASVAEAFTQKLIAEFAQYQPGDPADAATTLAPLSSVKAAQMLSDQVDQAVAAGAEVLVAGGLSGDSATAFAPILLGNMTMANPMADVEFFGPVGKLFIAKDEQQAIDLANASQYGLAGAVFGQSSHAREVALQLETGQVYINQAANGYPQMPFGGVKNSGYGREMSDLALFEFANEKIIGG